MTYGETINMDAEKKKAAKEDAEAKRKALAKATQDPERHTGGNKEDEEGEETEEKEGEK